MVLLSCGYVQDCGKRAYTQKRKNREKVSTERQEKYEQTLEPHIKVDKSRLHYYDDQHRLELEGKALLMENWWKSFSLETGSQVIWPLTPLDGIYGLMVIMGFVLRTGIFARLPPQRLIS